MKKLVILFALLGVVGLANATMLTHGSVGVGKGINVPHTDAACPGSLQLNFDGSAENGYCWQYGGIVAPTYGAFAECYSGLCCCGVELYLTGVGYPCGPLSIFCWADVGGMPGTVLCTASGFNPCPVPTYPSFGTYDYCFNPCCSTGGPFWVGYWANFSQAPCGYFIAADTNGFGGCPYTNVAPGIGYPTGWNNVSVIWGPTQSIGIGAWVSDSCNPVPVQQSTWGQIKNLYN